MTQNISNIYVNKFINEDGSKDDINYKMNKIKYLSPTVNPKRNKINLIFTSKNKVIENRTEINSSIDYRAKNFSFNKIDKFESNIKYIQSLVNNIKLEPNKTNNSHLEKVKKDNEINYFNIEKYPKEISKNNFSNLIYSIPRKNNNIK